MQLHVLGATELDVLTRFLLKQFSQFGQEYPNFLSKPYRQKILKKLEYQLDLTHMAVTIVEPCHICHYDQVQHDTLHVQTVSIPDRLKQQTQCLVISKLLG